jgi:hypothetical protein
MIKQQLENIKEAHDDFFGNKASCTPIAIKGKMK